QIPNGTFRLTAQDGGEGKGERGLRLTLNATKPPTLHGDNGLHQKTEQVGNASYYVSFTRLESEGEVSVNSETFKVRGLSWMDHEFSTAVLGPDDVGWDWFAIQLSDLREIMFYQIRRKDGSVEPLSSGTLVERDGTTRHLTNADVQLQVLDHWRSNASGANYPSRWSLNILSANIALTITPFMADQEMRVSFVYWEGASRMEGTSNGATVSGVGYVELTGYATPFAQ
ncbi:MAG: carotenoid 1,2-hydratase, partial [Chloroflexi bacterium]|nr:carotenoid 1,2-hydratase [Chloroflexota bacterium]